MKAKEWYSINVMTKDGEKIFETKNGRESFSTVAKVKSAGLAYRTAELMKTIYKPEYFSVVVD